MKDTFHFFLNVAQKLWLLDVVVTSLNAKFVFRIGRNCSVRCPETRAIEAPLASVGHSVIVFYQQTNYLGPGRRRKNVVHHGASWCGTPKVTSPPVLSPWTFPILQKRLPTARIMVLAL